MPRPNKFRGNKRKPFYKSHYKPKPQTSQPSNEYKHKNQLQETDVGITQFLSKLEGFSGIIKARFSDFHVNEIDSNGVAAKLTNQEIPKDFRNDNGKKMEEIPAETPLASIPQSTWQSVREMIQSGEKTARVELEATEVGKEERTQIIECLRSMFGRKIVCNTENDAGKRKMVFKKFDGKNDDRQNAWPKDKPEYVHFLVYKESIDTLDIALKLAHCLKVPPSSFAYAGVKDKRAKTTQWFSVRKVEPWKLIIKTKPIRNVRIGNITFKDQPLKLGDLYGNKFKIALRNVTGSDDLIEKSLQSLKNQGFINYFGLQRFGNDKEVPTYSIGVQLLLGNWKEACQIILKPTESDEASLDITKAKKVYAETGNATKALEVFTGDKHTSIEYLLLAGLSKENDNDYVNALSSIPRNTRLLYIHSFQSLVWNTIVSKRIDQFGLDVVEGDLVVVSEPSDSDSTEEEPRRVQVKALTADECSNHTVYDIVLPLPGYDVVYPEHLKQFYKEILESYGLTLEMTKQTVKDYNLSGTYRKMLGQVQDLSWKIMHYNEPNYNLIRSDLEELKGFEEPKSIEGGAYKALILEFSLDSSCYATMALREILKSDTSSSAHAKLNNYHEIPQKKIQMEVLSHEDNEEDNNTSDKTSLLNDLQKFEAFKNYVFNEEEPPLKRKHEEETEGTGKLAKVENDTT